MRRRAYRLLGRDEPGGLAKAIRACPRVKALLGAREPDGSLCPVRHVYKKWYGAHWALVDLAELGYPRGDRSLFPIRDQVLDVWLAPHYRETAVCTEASQVRWRRAVPVMEGRARRCASQQGNALYATVALGIADSRAHELVRLLIGWQWPDGGWNCDVNPAAHTSSFHETITPLRGLAAYMRWDGADPSLREEAREAVTRAAEVFLSRRLFLRRSNGEVMDQRFLALAFPRYWRYDLLFGLVVMKEAGLLADPRCREALDELKRRRHADGSWSAERKHYRVMRTSEAPSGSGFSRVDWGPSGKRCSNPWVTLDALEILAFCDDIE